MDEVEERPGTPLSAPPQSSDTNINVVVVDDEIDIRLLLRMQLADAGLAVVGEAANGREAIEVCQRLRPDVVVLDLLMPGMSGFDAIPQLLSLVPAPAVIAHSAGAAEIALPELRRHGVPLLVKNGDPAALIEAIRSATRRQSPRGPTHQPN